MATTRIGLPGDRDRVRENPVVVMGLFTPKREEDESIIGCRRGVEKSFLGNGEKEGGMG